MKHIKNFKDFSDKLKETAIHTNPNMNVQGMGEVEFPENPTDANSFSKQKPGSGDIPFNLSKKKKKKDDEEDDEEDKN